MHRNAGPLVRMAIVGRRPASVRHRARSTSGMTTPTPAASAAWRLSRRSPAACAGGGAVAAPRPAPATRARQDDDQPVGRLRGQRRGRPYLLETDGLQGRDKDLAEEVAWQGFETGEVDVILENWGHPDLEKKYITDKKVAPDAGPNGVTGIIGWYVPAWMVDKYPDITDWNNLNKYADLFKTSESGDKGQFLGSDPDVRPVRRGADHEPRPQLQGRLLGQRGGDDHGLPAGRRADKTPLHRLLLRPAVAA